ncbi:MAG: hypothetical protein JKX73_05810 [Flavobacteriales bacterium]|nr:hypothetical protein [Flavobacteriales bacterium]
MAQGLVVCTHNNKTIFLTVPRGAQIIEIMENPLKQFLYAGIGLAALTTEKVQSTLDELVEKGKISDSEAKKVAEDVISNLNGKRDEFEDKLGDVIKNVAEKLNYVKREDYENLQKRVKDLESELAKSKSKKTATAK